MTWNLFLVIICPTLAVSKDHTREFSSQYDSSVDFLITFMLKLYLGMPVSRPASSSELRVVTFDRRGSAFSGNLLRILICLGHQNFHIIFIYLRKLNEKVQKRHSRKKVNWSNAFFKIRLWNLQCIRIDHIKRLKTGATKIKVVRHCKILAKS